MSGDSDSINVNVLVSAKEEYTNILKTLLGPLIHSGFEQMYRDAMKTEPRYTLKKFQEFCKETQRWNQFMIDNEVAKVKEQYDWIYDLITAIFVINVKILTSIRLGGDSKNINIKMPSLEKFIHKLYISSGERFYYNPYLVQYMEVSKDNTIHNKKEQCLEIIEGSVDDAIKDLLPVQYILQEYLAKVMDEENSGEENSGEENSNDGSNDGSAIDGDGEQVSSDIEDDGLPNDDAEGIEDCEGDPNDEPNDGENDGDNDGEPDGLGDGLDENSGSDTEINNNKFGSQFRETEQPMTQPVSQPVVNQQMNTQPMAPQNIQPAFQPLQQPLQQPSQFGQYPSQPVQPVKPFSIAQNPQPTQNTFF
jgi:hypothetical protein